MFALGTMSLLGGSKEPEKPLLGTSLLRPLRLRTGIELLKVTQPFASFFFLEPLFQVLPQRGRPSEKGSLVSQPVQTPRFLSSAKAS